jgi:hypothetical protein
MRTGVQTGKLRAQLDGRLRQCIPLPRAAFVAAHPRRRAAAPSPRLGRRGENAQLVVLPVWCPRLGHRVVFPYSAATFIADGIVTLVEFEVVVLGGFQLVVAGGDFLRCHRQPSQ